MVGLLDIGPRVGPVTVRGNEWIVQGISAQGLFDLLASFPELRKLLSDAGVAVNPQELIMHVPGAVTTIIVYALGFRRSTAEDDMEAAMEKNKKYDAALLAASNLTIGEQTDIIKATWDLTFPKGLQSFLEALEAVGAIEYGRAQATVSPAQSSP